MVIVLQNFQSVRAKNYTSTKTLIENLPTYQNILQKPLTDFITRLN